MSKCAIVASGGGIKAFAFHIGVLRALEEQGFCRHRARGALATPTGDGQRIETYIGSSAGACFAAACVFLDTYEAMECALDLARGAFPPLGYRSLFRPALSRGGFFYASGIERYLKRHVTVDDFRAIGPEIYVVATQLNGPRKVVFGPKDSKQNGVYDPFLAYYNDVPISKAVAASISVPGLFAPYRITNKTSGETFEYTDGEVRETLSLHIARDTEVDLVIVSNTWMPYYYTRRVGSISRRGLWAVLNQTLTQMIEQKIDRFRNEYDRYRMVVDIIQDFARRQNLPPQKADQLVRSVSEVLRYRPMEEIYISPDAHDAEFNIMNAWTFNKRVLRHAARFGYERANRAVEAWRKGRAQAQERSLKPA